MTVAIARLRASDEGFDQTIDKLIAWDMVSDAAVEETVRSILAQVREQGDRALIELTNRFDRRQVESIDQLCITSDQLQEALQSIDSETRQALEAAATRIRDYHHHQKQESWQYSEADGTALGQQVTPLDRVGIYVPGGKASYPSSVLMNCIPARVAGVGEVVMMVPAPDNELSPMVLAAAAIAGVDLVYTVGGAQAVAALAYGTETVPRVDKIVGPGQYLCSHGQAYGVWHCGPGHGRRTQ